MKDINKKSLENLEKLIDLIDPKNKVFRHTVEIIDAKKRVIKKNTNIKAETKENK